MDTQHIRIIQTVHFLISINMDDLCHLFLQYTFILTASKELPKQCVGFGTTTVKYASRKNVGVRISDDPLCQAILHEMDAPLISTRFLSSLSHHVYCEIVDSSTKLWSFGVVNNDSVKGPKENEWMIDPTAIGDIYGPEVFIALTHSQWLKKIFPCSTLCFGFLLQGLDFLVDGGVRVAEPSTIVDMTGPYPKVIRQGKVIDYVTFCASSIQGP